MKQFLRYIMYKFLDFGQRYTRYEQAGKVQVSGIVKGLKQVRFEGNNKLATGANFNGTIEVGSYTTLGYNTTLHGTITIGKYCQLGPGVSIVTTNHPVHHLSTYINAHLFDGELKKLKEDKPVAIGHDVWVGQNAIILGGITVGNGAIIAAGAVVTKDVEAFAIVAGSPAKHIKYRFTSEVQEQINKLAWWNKTKEDLITDKALFFKNLKESTNLYS